MVNILLNYAKHFLTVNGNLLEAVRMNDEDDFKEYIWELYLEDSAYYDTSSMFD
jgi:hypothetical protein